MKHNGMTVAASAGSLRAFRTEAAPRHTFQCIRRRVALPAASSRSGRVQGRRASGAGQTRSEGKRGGMNIIGVPRGDRHAGRHVPGCDRGTVSLRALCCIVWLLSGTLQAWAGGALCEGLKRSPGLFDFRSCPKPPDDDWRRQRDLWIDELFRTAQPPPRNGVQTRVVLENFYAEAESLAEQIRHCVPDDQRAAMGHLLEFTRVVGINDDLYEHQFGMCVSDDDYVDRRYPALEIPPELREQAFLAAVSRDGGLPEAIAIIEAHNRVIAEAAQRSGSEPLTWKYLAFRSQFLTTPDCYSTYSRFLVVVPGTDFDRWVMFGIRSPEDTTANHQGCVPDRPVTISVVSARRHLKQGEPGTLAIDYLRLFRSNGRIDLKARFDALNMATNCLTCHKIAVNPIHPERVYEVAPDGALRGHVQLDEAPAQVRQTLTELNDWIRSKSRYIAFSPQPLYDPLAYGPPLACRPDRSHDDVVACATAAGLLSNDSDGIRAVEKSMSCGNCHAPGSDDFPALGPLNMPLTTLDPRFPLVGEMVAKVVMQGLMPPARNPEPKFLESAAPATPHDEAVRHALLYCLSQEYLHVDPAVKGPGHARGLLVDWLKSDRTYTADDCRKKP